MGHKPVRFFRVPIKKLSSIVQVEELEVNCGYQLALLTAAGNFLINRHEVTELSGIIVMLLCLFIRVCWFLDLGKLRCEQVQVCNSIGRAKSELYQPLQQPNGAVHQNTYMQQSLIIAWAPSFFSNPKWQERSYLQNSQQHLTILIITHAMNINITYLPYSYIVPWA